MKLAKILLVVSIILLVLASTASAAITEAFLDRIAKRESRNNPLAIGDNGKARGAYQMWECAWADAESRLRWGLTWEHGAHSKHARAYARTYCGILSERLRRKLRREPTQKEIYRSYRGMR